ncbi:hypothetical protein TRFO_11442 [Tritrichomonas foetus]|uniref:Uncharacterized protein n=1 Tax=Tritrichomonas foetus TaxID=1144522 RepID=A0A1J4J3N1_9EUKA|nr:hypothetical protein TRFO_11442 [Tritrichomonas foetus]|eukprot:OHS93970.1 hypothetical protein TRFO_11442 [Tritrichomonas foetus]
MIFFILTYFADNFNLKDKILGDWEVSSQKSGKLLYKIECHIDNRNDNICSIWKALKDNDEIIDILQIVFKDQFCGSILRLAPEKSLLANFDIYDDELTEKMISKGLCGAQCYYSAIFENETYGHISFTTTNGQSSMIFRKVKNQANTNSFTKKLVLFCIALMSLFVAKELFRNVGTINKNNSLSNGQTDINQKINEYIHKKIEENDEKDEKDQNKEEENNVDTVNVDLAEKKKEKTRK